MTPSTTGTSRGATPHPARAPKTQACLDARGLNYSFHPDYPVAQIREVEGNQVRLIKNRAPKHMVDRYQQQMQAGATFPAILINDGGEVIDGNTRLAATRKLGRGTIAAYVVSDLNPTVARLLSVELNQCHGESMSPKEVQAVIVSTIRDGQSINVESMARMTGVKPSKIRRWIKDEDARKRAASFGVPLEAFDRLKESDRVALGRIGMKSVFITVTNLALDTELTASEIQEIVKSAIGATSESEALAVVASARDERAIEIAAKATGFKVVRLGAAAARHFAALDTFNPSDLSDVAPEKVQEAIERMENVQSKIKHALDMLRGSAVAEAA